ncbi:MAG: CoA-binding protein [Candidatus Aenigmarchaeota archaeon]|nr:CoA-binding protein [Candidatus Aenigmarchaeota archaeon]
MPVSEFFNRKNKIAIIGASPNPDKYSYKIYIKLKNSGFSLLLINPNHDSIEGDKCYPSLESLPKIPDVVITFVPPIITEGIVAECKELGIKKVWMQPGSESEKAIVFCEENGIEVIHNACFVVDGLKERFDSTN